MIKFVKFVKEDMAGNRLTFKKNYKVNEEVLVDGVVFVEIIDNLGTNAFYALEYENEVWFKDVNYLAKVRDKKIKKILGK